MTYTNPRYSNEEGGIIATADDGNDCYFDPATSDAELQAMYDALQSGVYGTVAAYVVPVLPTPTAEELRAILPNLTMRQFRLQLLEDGLLTNVQAAIDGLPSPQKEAAQIDWEYASMVERNNTFVQSLMPVLNLTDEQVDVMWNKAILK